MSDGTVLAGTSIADEAGAVYRSDDGGATWTWMADLGGGVRHIASTETGIVYAGLVATFEGGLGGVFRSADRGETWVERLDRSLNVTAITTGPRDVIAVGVDGVQGVAESQNPAEVWAWSDLPRGNPSDVLYAEDGTLYVSHAQRGSLSGVYQRRPGSEAWDHISDGFESLSVRALRSGPGGYLYASTSHGVYRTAEPFPVSASPEARSLALALDAAYPNPASGVVTLSFTLAEAAEATVTVRDVLGRTVATVVDATLSPGEHTATWNATTHAGGVYVVTLSTRGKTVSRRVTVAR